MKLNVTIQPRFRISLFPLILMILAGIAFVVAIIRFIYGIGAVSNLSNAYPWGFWVSFDLFTGIAISSGAFILASIVYIFEMEEFRPLLRPTLLTGLLGYIMEVIALMVDLGHPERIWHYFVYQNFNSFLLLIGFYVMIYSTVMAVEFAPAILEKFKWHKAANLIRSWMKPIVIVGAVLSTLHQAALGSLLLIQPVKLHPLWWTPIIPPLFFVSAWR
jgi:Ni/Fe-hydrogenase subunit HybB-like protein